MHERYPSIDFRHKNEYFSSKSKNEYFSSKICKSIDAIWATKNSNGLSYLLQNLYDNLAEYEENVKNDIFCQFLQSYIYWLWHTKDNNRNNRNKTTTIRLIESLLGNWQIFNINEITVWVDPKTGESAVFSLARINDERIFKQVTKLIDELYQNFEIKNPNEFLNILIAKSFNGNNSLICAIQSGNVNFVQLILNNVWKLFKREAEYQYKMSDALMMNITHFLIKGPFNKSPLEWAFEKSQSKIPELLLNFYVNYFSYQLVKGKHFNEPDQFYTLILKLWLPFNQEGKPEFLSKMIIDAAQRMKDRFNHLEVGNRQLHEKQLQLIKSKFSPTDKSPSLEKPLGMFAETGKAKEGKEEIPQADVDIHTPSLSKKSDS